MSCAYPYMEVSEGDVITLLSRTVAVTNITKQTFNGNNGILTWLNVEVVD